MKKMKKLLAFVLAFAMIITIYQPTKAYAATKKPVLSAKSITLQVGKQKTLKVKNAGKNATIQWSSSKKTVAAVSKKGVVKAVKAGTAKVICKVTTKQNKNYKLVCKVVVKNAPVKTVSRTVTNQQELEAALKAKNLSKLIIKTDDETAFTIPEGTYNKVALVVDAPKADVTNNAKFKSVAIKAIKPDTYRENAKGNTIIVSAANARVIIEAGASVTNITVSEANGSVKLVVDGALSGIIVDAPAAVTVEGKNTTAVPVTVSEKAAGATVSSSTPVEVKASAPVSVTLTKGAEGSKVETTTDKAEVTVKNDTTAAVTVVTPAGNKEVAKDSTAKVDNTGKISDTNANTNAGGSTSGGSVTPTPTPDPTPSETYTLYALHLFAANQMDVEIPEKITDKDKIEVRDEAGKLQKVAELKDMYADNKDVDRAWQRYMITFASDLTPGKYTFSYTGKTKIYQGEFEFTSESFAKTKAAAEKIQTEIFGQTFDIPEEGKDNASYAAQKLNERVYALGQENKFWAKVIGGYTANYDTVENEKSGLTVRIRVAYGYVVQDLTGMVYFTFNEQTYTLYALHLFAANQMDVEIPEKITDKDKIEVRDADGNLQKVAELKDMYADEDDEEEDEEDDVWQRYMITFASDLTPGKYTFSYTGKTKIYQGTFQFAAESFAKTKAAAEKVQAEIFGQTFDILPKGKDDVVYAADQLDKIAYAYGQENDFWAGVYDYADAYTTSEDGTVGLEVTIRVQGEIGAREDEAYADAVQDLTGIVYFTFDKQQAEVKVPQVIFETQTSIVVKAEEGQTYVCLDADKIPDEDDWEDAFYVEGAEDVDDFGNIEFDKLSIGKSYRIWSRNIKEADVEQKSDEITLTEKNPQIVCLADSDEKVQNLGTVTTSEEDDRVIQIPRSVKISNYGQVPENMYLHGETDNVVLMKDGQKIESGVSVSLPHSDLAEVYSVDGFEKGKYTLTYDYYYCCSDKDTNQRAVGSPAVTYQVTFTIE